VRLPVTSFNALRRVAAEPFVCIAAMAMFMLSGCDGSESLARKAVTTASAGIAQIVHGGSGVTLAGGATPAPGATILSYAWTQTAGPAVILTGADTATVTFTAPTVAAQTTFAFTLTVADSLGYTASATVNVAVQSQHDVVISWSANRETAVNRNSGGYRVSITGQPTVLVPYASGALAPTTTTVSLWSGSYTVTVAAYSSLNPPGGSSGSVSAASSPITVVVP